MNIVEACRLMDKFGGFGSISSLINCGDEYPYLGLSSYRQLIWYDEKRDDMLKVFDLSSVTTNDWLYYNDKFECLTCEECYKLLNDMDGVGPVCECNNSIRITNAPAPVIQTEDALAPIEDRTIKSAPKQGNIPREDIWEAIKNVVEPHINKEMAKCDDTLLYEFIKDCQIDGVLHRAGERVLWKKSKAKFIEDGGIIEIASNNPYWPPRVSAQYPGMVEVNYLDGRVSIFHFSNLSLAERAYGYYVQDDTARIETAIVNSLSSANDGGKDYSVSKEEYYRILNLFKASGLEVKE